MNHFKAIKVLLILLIAGVFTPLQAQQQTVQLRMLISPPSANRVPIIVAADEGIYERNGLDVTLFTTPEVAEAMRRDGMMINPQFVEPLGELTPIGFGLGTGIAAISIDEANFDNFVIIATLDNVTRGHIVAQPEITSLEQLRGKRLGYTTPAGRTQFVAMVTAQQMGWDPARDITLVSNVRVNDLLEGRVDAIIANENRLIESRDAGYEPLFDVSSWNIPIASTGVSVDRTWLQNNRETVRRFMKSVVEAIALVNRNKQTALRSMEKWWGISDRAKQEAFYAGAIDIPPKPYPSVEGIRKIMEVYDSTEMREYMAEDFYDDSFIRELDESGYIDSLY